MYRVVFDTNIYISWLVTPAGSMDQLMRYWRQDLIVVIISEYILIEVQRILIQKFKIDAHDAQRHVSLFSALAINVQPTPITSIAGIESADLPIILALP